MTDAEYNRKCAEDVMGWTLEGESYFKDGEPTDYHRNTLLYEEFDPANNPAHAMMVLDKRGTWTCRKLNNYLINLNNEMGNFARKDFCSAARAAICAAEGWE